MFCRVRPLLPGENNGDEGKTISYPASLELLGRGIDLMQNGMKLIKTSGSCGNDTVLFEKTFVVVCVCYGQRKSIRSHSIRCFCLIQHKKTFSLRSLNSFKVLSMVTR